MSDSSVSQNPPLRQAIDFEALFQSMPSPFMILDRELRFVAANTAYLATTARIAAELIGVHVFDAFPESGERKEIMRKAFMLALAGTENTASRTVFAIDIPGKGRKEFYWDVHHTPVRDAAGSVIGLLQYAQNVSAQVEAERMRDVISQEYDHRIRNMMARISAIARQTASDTYDSATFLADFDRRIMAMARTHELLLNGGWDELGLRALVESALQPHAHVPTANIHLEGLDHTLSSRIGQALGMALHELATNAAKYGALGHLDGRLSIVWHVGDDQGLRIEWRESGLADVLLNAPAGFGSTIIDRVLPLETGGRVERTLSANGLVCTIDIPDPMRV